MLNKKAFWMGLAAILTIPPILVANPPQEPRPVADNPRRALAPENQGAKGLGVPQSSTSATMPIARQKGPAGSGERTVMGWNVPQLNAAVDVHGRYQTSTPFLSPQPANPNSLFVLAGGQEPKEGGPGAVPSPVATEPATFDFSGIAKDSAAGIRTQSGGKAIAPTSGGPAGDVGSVLGASNASGGVELQRRSPLVSDPRIQGLHFGQIVTHADGGYWFPARVDLDTVVSKMNSGDIKSIGIIQGPFSVRYGAGFSFLDVESVPTPRSTLGHFDAHGSTSGTYKTNGRAWQGQQSVWGGGKDWGFRITYDAQAAVDYTAGNGSKLPSGYNNQFVNFAYGIDLSQTASLEVKYLHVQQSDVLFPGLLTNINSLTTDAFTARFVDKDGAWYDRFTLDAWVNNTVFNGNSANPETRRQIPQLDDIFKGSFTAFQPIRLDINTQGNALTYGTRQITTWGDAKGFNVSLGADIRVFDSNYREADAFNLSVLQGTGGPPNLGIPRARQIAPGILLDSSVPLGEYLVFKLGTRMDFVTNQFVGFDTNVDLTTYNKFVGDPTGDRVFSLFSGFATGEFKITPEWTLNGGYGYAQRSPTTTELYAGGAFLGLIQNGFNSIYGNPSLRREEMHNLNLGLHGKYEAVRVGANGFAAYVPNYITYLPLGKFATTLTNTVPPLTGTTPINQLQFINTPHATLTGFDAYGEVDATPYLTPFVTASYVKGMDRTKGEPLPGIAPLSSRAGLRFHEDSKNPRYGVEYFARIVAPQNLFAASLGEARTGGFVTHNVRAYWQVRENLLVLGGVENIGDLYYREHLDLRTGLGVFQPGVNFYFGAKLTY
ncbi:MAG: TonB-dependent receptor [Planctomycetes bacterium]|nr:TonB-dependent receptor [Planctomycetota bacterium]